MVPYIQKGLDVVDNLTQKWDSLSTAQQDNIIKFAALAAAIGPVVVGIGTFVTSIGTLISAGGTIVSVIGALTPVFVAVGSAIVSLGVSALSALPGVIAFMAPFAPFIAIGAAVVAAGVLIYKNWDKIKEVAAQVGAVVAEKWDGIKSKTAEAWGNVKAKTAEVWNGVKSTVTTVGSAIATNAASSLSRIKNAYQSHGGGIKGVVAATWTGIKEYYTMGFRTLDTLTKGKLTEIKNIFTDKFKNLKNDALNWGKDMLQGFIDGISSKLEALKNVVSKPAQMIADIWHHSHPTRGPLAKDYTWMPDMMKMFAQGINKYSYLVQQAADNAATDIMVGMSAAQALEYQREAAGSNLRGEVDASAIYAAVREGASDATISISIDGRELRRTLDGLGVVLA